MNEIAGQIKFSLPFLSIVLSKSCIILLFHFWSIIEALVVFEFKEILNFEIFNSAQIFVVWLVTVLPFTNMIYLTFIAQQEANDSHGR